MYIPLLLSLTPNGPYVFGQERGMMARDTSIPKTEQPRLNARYHCTFLYDDAEETEYPYNYAELWKT